MTKHLLRLVWNRKRSNFLITVEIVLSFLVLFLVMSLAVSYGRNYVQPLGFQYDHVWRIDVNMGSEGDDVWTPEMKATSDQVLLALRAYEQIEAVAGVQVAPFSIGGIHSNMHTNGREIEHDANEVTDDFANVMRLDLVRGRWFRQDDDTASFEPVVINQRMARELFGDEEPIGQELSPRQDDGLARRVVGVVSAYREDSVFQAPDNYLFYRKKMGTAKDRPPQSFIIRLKPGTPAAFENELQEKLGAVARGWTFDIQSLEAAKEQTERMIIQPLVIAGLVAAFLILMVGLGLTGVLWQNVTQRRGEIGLRRANGATARGVCLQILGELTLVTTTGLAIGSAIVIQLFVIGASSWIDKQVFAGSLAASIALIYLLTILCGLYPSLLATRIHPAEALHYE
jgi:putative ABC transport system permease protein